MKKADAPYLALLAAAAAICYGSLSGLGFYLDDWSLLSDMFFQGTSLRRQLEGAHAYRPLSVLTWTVPYLFFGLKAPLWHACMLALQWCVCAAFYLVLRSFSVSRLAAFLGCVFFLGFPNKDSTLYWPDVSLILSASLLFFLLAWLAYARGRAWTSAALLLVSLCFYEQVFFLLPVWLLAPNRPRRGLAVCAGAVLLFGLAKFVVLPGLIPYHKSFSFSIKHVFFVYYMAARATLDPRWLLYLGACAAQAFLWFPLLALLAALLPWAAARLPGQDKEKPADPRLLWWGAAVWLLGYLPLCFSAYAPSAYDEMNRLNQLPALGLAALACGLASGRRWKALAALASFGLVLHVAFAEIWRESYRRQLEVKAAVLARLAQWPADKWLILRLPETYAARKAPVFISGHDVSGAIRIWTNDSRRNAWAYTEWVRFDSEGAEGYGARMPYSRLMFMDMETGYFGPLNRRVASSIPPYLHPWEKPVKFWSRS